MRVVYSILDIIIQENDELFIFFFLTAFVSSSKGSLSEDISHLPSSLSSLSIKSIEDCHQTYLLACEMRERTPYSFRLYVRSLGIFSGGSKKYSFEVEKLMALPILPSELLYYTYNNIIRCPDQQCKCFYRKSDK